MRGPGYDEGMTEPADVTVQDNPEKNRYEACDDAGVVAGFAAYTIRDGTLVFTHTEVDDAFEGRGIGSALARGALDDARERSLPVRPDCQFIRGYIEKHDEYADLVA
jgi:predicted GNAT family acetyltransferase